MTETREDVTAVDTLVVAAHALELEPLKAALAVAAGRQAGADGASAEGALAPGRMAMATVGVGLARAGSGMARALTRYRPQRVVLVGSAGAYESASLDLGALVVADDVHLLDATVVDGRAAMPEPMLEVPVCDRALSAELSGAGPIAMRVGVATTLGITTDDGLARTLDAAGPWQVENLELFAVALACADVGVPLAALLAITNVVGAQGRAQWRMQHLVAAEQTARVVMAWLNP